MEFTSIKNVDELIKTAEDPSPKKEEAKSILKSDILETLKSLVSEGKISKEDAEKTEKDLDDETSGIGRMIGNVLGTGLSWLIKGGTLAEDVLTGGAGIADDIPSFILAEAVKRKGGDFGDYLEKKFRGLFSSSEEKVPEGKAPLDSFAGIDNVDHLLRFALERKRFHIEQLHQELGNVIAEIKRNIGETTFKVLGSMDIIYNSSEQDIEEVTEEFKNAVSNAIQDLEELKGKSFSSVDEKIVKMQRRLKFLLETSIESPEENYAEEM